MSTLGFGSTKNRQANFKFFLSLKRMQVRVHWCALKVVVHVALLTFVIFLFTYDDQINEKETTWVTEGRGWVMEGRGQKRKLLSSHHLIIFLKLPKNQICFCLQGFFSTWSRGGFIPGGTISSRLEQQRLKSLYCARHNQPIEKTSNSNSPRIYCVFYIFVCSLV